MSQEKWTSSQKEAIIARHGNLLVAAAAGSGKTSVLVERIISYLKDSERPLDIDGLLVVTFTNAAAAQMREQIGRALAKELNIHPSSRHLRRQLTLLNYASIATLHSFCLEVLRQHFYRLELDPNFRIADEGEASLLQLEVLEELLEVKYQQADNVETPEGKMPEGNNVEKLDVFLKLVDSYGGERDDAGLIELVLNLYRFTRSNPWPEHWLKQAAGSFHFAADQAIDDFVWCPGLKKSIALQLQECHRQLEQAVKLCRRPQAPHAYLDNLILDLDLVQALAAACGGTWQDMFQAFQEVEFGRLKAVRKNDEIDPFIQEQVKNQRDEVKKLVCALRDTYFWQSPAAQLQDLSQAAPLMTGLVELVLEFGESFRQAKHRRGIVDFSDLEHYCLQILLGEGSEPGKLIPSPVALELRERFAEVLVDEYQDINAVQEAILQLVSRQDQGSYPNQQDYANQKNQDFANRDNQENHEKQEKQEIKPNLGVPNLFMVGDVKQSIYRFRLADPGLFLERYQQFSGKKGARQRRISLNENFRSCQNIVDGINFFFRQIMTAYVGEMAYDKEAELVCGFRYPPVPLDNEGVLLSPEIEIFLMDRQKETSTSDAGEANQESPELGEGTAGNEDLTETGVEATNEEELLDTAEIEARVISRQLRQMVEQEKQIWDHKEERYRPVRYGDMAVLMRATRGLANVFIDEFRKSGIPAYAELGTGYFAAGEVEIMLSLLQIIDNPLQDIPLAAVLRSPLVGLSADEMAQVRAVGGPGRSYYQALVTAAIASGSAATAGSVWNQKTQERIQAFLAGLDKWRTLARRERLTTLLWEIWQHTGYYDYVGGMPGGAQRQANLRLLQTWAGEYESTAFRGLSHFLRFVERLRETGGDRGTARTLSENENVVRIMSIHKSKGLEFPVVCVAGLGRQFNLSDLKGKILNHKDWGFGPQLVNLEWSITYPTIAKLALQQRIKLETLAEEIRLLYVAMTRAREKLLLVGSAANLSRKAAAWCQMAQSEEPALPEAALARARCYLDWVAPAFARHAQSRLLWETAGLSGSKKFSLGEEAQFKVQILGPGETSQLLEVRPVVEELLERVRDGLPLEAGEMAGEIARRLQWQYPLKGAVGKGAKLTVSEIKRLFESMPEEEAETVEAMERVEGIGDAPETRLFQLKKQTFISQPRFIQEKKGLTPAERGSAMHLVIQNLNLKGPLDREAILQQITEFTKKEMLTPEQAEVIDPDIIGGFFAGALGQRILRAQKVYRELPFSMAIPAGKVYPDMGEDSCEQVMVQGVIDCLADEKDGFLLIDYKTDWLGPGRLEELTERYRWQLLFYAQAVEVIFKRPVKEMFLYFLAGGVEQIITRNQANED